MSKFLMVSRLSLTGFALFYSLLGSAAVTPPANLDSSTALNLREIAEDGKASKSLNVATENTLLSATEDADGNVTVCNSKSDCIVLSSADFNGYYPDPNCPKEQPDCNKK